MTSRKIRQALLICFFIQIGSVFFGSSVFAQRPVSTSEIGIGIGGANYKGELAPNYRFLNNQPAITAFYRRDVSSAITLRGGLMGSHRIVDNNTIGDKNYDLPYQNFRRAEMRLSLAEISAVMEYNFLDYYDLSQPIRVSPYFFVGVAGLLYNVKTTSENPQFSNINDPYRTTLTFSVPIGVGVKYALSKHWNLGLEFGARKLFNDRIDNLYGQDERLSNPHDNDWYYYNGISLSYTLYRVNCPPPYKNQPGILD